ncbi:MAG: hypothetical protein KBS52_03675 [Clostridiales bacterium]|nr:hypothetical protein [Candidatus Equinaster intestinalis]
MKFNFKQISRKALAVVVAVLMVASCCAISFTVFAETKPFVVPSASPAIPLVEGFGITLSNLSIEVGGKYVGGETLTWGDPVEGTSAVVIGDKLIGREPGLSCFTVSDAGGNKQNIWVLVNEEGNTDYSFVNSDFSNDKTYNLKDWVGSAATANKAASPYIFGAYAIWSGGSQPSIVGGDVGGTHVYHYGSSGEQIDSSVLKVGGPNALDGAFVTFYRNKALKDFGDYTIETKLASVVVNGTAGQAERRVGATGIIARAALSDDAWTIDGAAGSGQMALASDANSLFLRIRNYGGISIAGLNANTKAGMNYEEVAKPYLGDDQAIIWHTAPAATEELYKGEKLDKTKVLMPTPQGNPAVETLSDIKVELKGTGIKYSINGNVIFDTIAENDLVGINVPINDAETTEASTAYASGLLVNEFPDAYTTTSMTNADYIAAYNNNLKAAKGAVGISNQYGEITHISTFKVTAANLIGVEMPAMSEVTVDNVFSTTASSPAIPLYKGKSVSLKLLSIGFKDGSAIVGNKLTWERISGNAAKIVEGKLVGMFEGIAGFKVSDGAKTQNVWVIVNAQGNDDFKLIDLDFSKEGAYNASDWLVGKFTGNPEDIYGKAGNAKYGIYASGKYLLETDPDEIAKYFSFDSNKKALYMPAMGQYHVSTMAAYKSEMMNDFLDYQVDADMSIVMEREDKESCITAPGIFTRLYLNAAASKAGDYIIDAVQKPILFRFRNYGGILIDAPNSSDDVTTGGVWETPYLGQEPNTGYYTLSDEITGDTLLRPGEALNMNLITYPDAKDAQTLTKRNVKFDLVGKDMSYTLDGHNIFNTFDHNKTIGRFVLSSNNSSPWAYSGANQIAYSSYSGGWMVNNIHNAYGGTIGIANNYGAGFYLYKISVVPQNIATAELLPAMKDAGDIKVEYQVPQNTRLDLSEVDADVVWTDDNSSSDYIVKDGVLVVLKGGRPVTVKGQKGEQDFNTNVATSKIGTTTDYPVTKFADDNMVVTKAGSDFTVLINQTLEIVPGSLKVTEAGETAKISDYTYDVKKGVTYNFAADLTDAVLSVEYAAVGDMAKKITNDFAAIPADLSKKQLKFGFTIPSIRDNKGTIALDSTTYVEGGKQMTLLNVGALVIPKAFLGSAALRIPSGAEFDATSASATVSINGYDAKNVPIVVLSDATPKFSKANVALNYNDGAADVTKYDAEIATVVYVQYQDDSGNIGYLYGETAVESYQSVFDKLPQPPQ